MSFRNFPRDLMRRTTPAHGVIKRKAHAATVAAAALIVPSLCAIYFWRAGMKEDEAYWVWASTMVWRIHAVVAAIALLLWVFEKPKLTTYMRDDAASWRKVGRTHPRAMLIGLAVVAVLFGWLAFLQFELAYESWRWGKTVRAIGRALGALPLLVLTAIAGFAPVAIVLVTCRRLISGPPKADKTPEL